MTDELRTCLAVLMVTGCRPAELSEQHGVTMGLTECGDEEPRLILHIESAKVTRAAPEAARDFDLYYKRPQSAPPPDQEPDEDPTDDRGQPWRLLEIGCVTPEARWLWNTLRSQEFHDEMPASMVDVLAAREPAAGMSAVKRIALPTVAMTASGAWLDPAERDRRVSVKIGKLVARIGQHAFPRLTARLTPYVFRHALAADLKGSGVFCPGEISAALGHLSTRTASTYGASSIGRGKPCRRALQIRRIEAPLNLRHRPRPGAAPGASAGSR